MKTVFEKQKAYFDSNQTKSYEFRVAELRKLKQMIKTNEDNIVKALYEDLHKSPVEAYTTEIGFVLSSIDVVIKNLKKWMKPKKVKTPLFMFGSKSYIMSEPLGTVLIIGPYNYPFQLVIEPLIGAIASGNTAILKPSEYTSSTEKLLVEMLDKTFGDFYIKVLTGSKEVTTRLLELKFDHIFFTGSTEVGKVVYQSANKNLIPVTLELGGKSPTIVDRSANLKLAARRIVFGKLINAGQTCIAPDYVYVSEDIREEFIFLLIKEVEKMYPNHEGFGRIVNDRHFKRLEYLIEKKKVIYGNEVDAETKFISPTILDQVTWDDKIMKEEIFGPILPVLTFKDLNEVVAVLKTKEKPLALYLFSNDKNNIHFIFNELSFGNGAINDTLMQVANPNLPFGGVGNSGMGRYHGKSSFDTFSNQKTYIKKTNAFDIKIGYPPYSTSKEKWIRRFLK